MPTRRRSVIAAGGGLLGVCGVGLSTLSTAGDRDPASGHSRLVVGTTLYDSGLAEELAAAVAETCPHLAPAPVPRGTGAALRALAAGDVAAAIVHHPRAERRAVATGDAVDRRPFCVNDFLLVGPPGDPAGAADATDAAAAFDEVAAAGERFLSRGDDSGTHARERRIWDAADRDSHGDWYGETGSSMGETLRIAGSVGAYTLVDRGTFLARRGTVDLETAFATGLDSPSELLRNVYSVLRPPPDRVDEAGVAAGRAIAETLAGDPGREAVRGFRADGERAYRPVEGTDSSDRRRSVKP
ncbi:substrate-binding domain-containing protein [Haloparvum sedimenti]|uniref:substrate-binding domain-containing protein n=1 Tax=Haloparvum sedimenti TaxID=1678448 RepID=UPI00071E7672|nr:substrate-binding domain-containing protein [Haloparvum sedimenti]